GAEVEILDPFKKIEYEEGIFETEPAKIAPIAALSIGLAIRGE
ncbi:pilus assembly protein PilM, partial [bacterium]